MKTSRVVLMGVFCLGVVAVVSAALAAAPVGEADLVLVNGKVITVDAQDTVARAVAIAAGKILKVGGNLEVLRIHTMGSAYAGFAETTTGSLEPGKYADLVVWSHDLYSLSPADVNDLRAEMTIVNGEIVYEAQALP